MSNTDFESFVIRLTSRFTGLPGAKLEDAVRQTLAELVTFLGSGRATLLECQDDSSTLVTAYSASDGSAPPFPEGTSLALPLVRQNYRRAVELNSNYPEAAAALAELGG